MDSSKRRGFTVIELMLFLGVTGALFAALMIGVNTNLLQQRYKESVQSYVGLLQEQYAAVSNTRNDRGNDWACVDGRVVNDSVNGSPRGTSRCVILGRAVQVVNDGAAVRVSVVVASESIEDEPLDDISALIAYAPQLSPLGEKTQTLDWHTTLATHEDKHPSKASFLVLRSPMSGTIRTFTFSDELPADISTVIAPHAATRTIQNCMLGSVLGQPTFLISVNPTVSGPNAVRVDQESKLC